MSENLCPLCFVPITGKRNRCYRCKPAIVKVVREYVCETCGKQGFAERWETKKRFCSYDCANKGKQLKGPGARRKRYDGYIAVYYPSHPDVAPGSRFIMEHRLVMEQKIGRRLKTNEHVHHINGIRDDNRPENLEILDASTHAYVSHKQGVQKRKAMREELAALRIEVAAYRERFGPLAGLPSQAQAA